MSFPATSQQPHILAIDDDSLILRYLSIALERAGYRPTTVDDPETVVGQIREDPPDLILLDLRLPGVDGFHLYGDIREVSASPVIFLSASSRVEDRRRALTLGASAFLVKPFSPAELMSTIKHVLNHAQST